jgi:hypothetical protein
MHSSSAGWILWTDITPPLLKARAVRDRTSGALNRTAARVSVLDRVLGPCPGVPYQIRRAPGLPLWVSERLDVREQAGQLGPTGPIHEG